MKYQATLFDGTVSIVMSSAILFLQCFADVANVSQREFHQSVDIAKLRELSMANANVSKRSSKPNNH